MDEITLADLKASGALHYLGSPYSKFPRGTWAACKVVSPIAGRLIENGVPIFCPIAHSHPIAIYGSLDPLSHDLWLPVDAHLMRVCGAMLIAKMTGWDQSFEISEEVKVFRAADKPIYTLDPVTLSVEVYACV